MNDESYIRSTSRNRQNGFDAEQSEMDSEKLERTNRFRDLLTGVESVGTVEEG